MNLIFFKALKDLWATKSKTFLVFTALIIGVFGLGTIIYTYSMAKRDLSDNYLRTNPCSVILNGENISSDLISQIQDLSYVIEVEERELAVLRARSNNSFNWMPIYIYAIKDFQNLRLNTFTLDEGQFPKTDEIVVERDGLRFLDGESLTIQTDSNNQVVLYQSGIVHDPGQPPSHMDHVLWTYVNPTTFDLYFEDDRITRLMIKFKDYTDLASIERNTQKLISFIGGNGGEVIHYIIPPPNEHPHQGQLQSLLFLQAGMGGLAVLLSIILLFTVISSIMSEQIRQIGIMKSMGASRRQLLIMYITGISFLAMFAIVIALPLAYKVSLAYSGYIAKELNFDLLNTSIPPGLNILLILAGFGIPIVASLLPIIKATTIKVKRALDYQHGGNVIQQKTRSAGRYKFTPLWLSIAHNNTFLNKPRLILSVITMMLGLGLFSIGLNISTSLDNTFQNNMNKKRYDFNIKLKKATSDENIRSILGDFPDIKNWEVWQIGTGHFVDSEEMPYDAFDVVGIKDNTTMWDMQLIKGEVPKSWDNVLVMNAEFKDRFPDVDVGDSISLLIGGEIHPWYVAGLVSDIGVSSVYTSKSALQKVSRSEMLASDIKIKGTTTKRSFDHLIMELEQDLEENKIYVDYSNNQSEFLTVLRDHIGVIMSFLLAMASLVLIIGGLGMISLMNINIRERRKDIGIMRATGAGKWSINRIIAVEMLLVGLMSWFAGLLLATPLSRIISDFFGKLILKTPLDFVANPSGPIATFFIMLTILFLSAIFPIRNSMKISINNTLNQIT